MSTPQRSMIQPFPGFRSQEAASFMAQMDDQSRLLLDRIKDITPEELEWQPKPGMNTIGMLLAHLAIVEAWWTCLVVKGQADAKGEPIIGIGWDDDGMPVPEEGRAPANLAGKDLAYYTDLMRKARAFVTEAAKGVSDADLEREVSRKRPDGTERVINVRWYFYHMLEHFSGHFGQVLLLRHMFRAAQVPAKT